MHHGRRGWQTVVVVQQADGTWRRTEARLEEKWDDTHFLCFCIPKQILNGRVKITWECMHMQTHAHAHVSICGDVQACLAQTSTDAHVYVVDTPQHTSPLRNTHTHTGWQTCRKANKAAWKSVALQIICWPSTAGISLFTLYVSLSLPLALLHL